MERVRSFVRRPSECDRSVTHAGCCSEGCEYRCCDARYELHDPLEGFLLRHSLPPSFIISSWSMLFQSLVVAATGLVVSALAKELGAYLTGLTVLDGDSLNGSRVAQGETSLVEYALC